MDDPSRPEIRGVQTWARAAAVAELRPALGVPDEVVEAYVDAAALLIEFQHHQAAYVLLQNIGWPPGRTVPVAAASAAWRVLAGGRRVRRPVLTSAAPRPSWASYDYADRRRTGVLPPGAVRLKRSARDGPPARLGRRRSVRPIAGGGPGQTSSYSVPVQLEPDEARLFAAALDEGARLVDRARAVTR